MTRYLEANFSGEYGCNDSNTLEFVHKGLPEIRKSDTLEIISYFVVRHTIDQSQQFHTYTGQSEEEAASIGKRLVRIRCWYNLRAVP